MLVIAALVILYCLTSVSSIVLLGDKQLISGNLYDFKNVFYLIINWKFIISMSLAVVTRLTFILINNTLLTIPKLAKAATTITTFITLISLVFIVVANHFFLNERLNINQGIGAFIVLVGIAIMFS